MRQIPQIICRQEPFRIGIYFFKDSRDILRFVLFVGLFTNHLYELSEIDVAALVGVVHGHSLVDVVAFGVVAVVFGHSLQEVAWGKDAVHVGVEGVEDLLPYHDVALARVLSGVFAWVYLHP